MASSMNKLSTNKGKPGSGFQKAVPSARLEVTVPKAPSVLPKLTSNTKSKARMTNRKRSQQR